MTADYTLRVKMQQLAVKTKSPPTKQASWAFVHTV